MIQQTMLICVENNCTLIFRVLLGENFCWSAIKLFEANKIFSDNFVSECLRQSPRNNEPKFAICILFTNMWRRMNERFWFAQAVSEVDGIHCRTWTPANLQNFGIFAGPKWVSWLMTWSFHVWKTLLHGRFRDLDKIIPLELS